MHCSVSRIVRQTMAKRNARLCSLLLVLVQLVVCFHGVSVVDAASETEAVSPEFRWAQRKDRVLITIDLQGVSGETFSISSDGLFVFAGRGSYRDQRDRVGDYRLELQLLKGLNASDSSCGGFCEDWKFIQPESTCKVTEGSGPWEKCVLSPEVVNVTHCAVHARDVECVLMKSKREKYWTSLLKGGKTIRGMHVDWSKWLDEEKDGVRWNDQVDRAWEWWRDDDDDEDEEEEERLAREEEEKKRRAKSRRRKQKKAAQGGA